MAQTKRRRRTKHRGNAAGIVEARGRTGRKPDASERKLSARDEARQRREERMNRPPTWKGAFQRAGMAAGLFAVLITIFFKQKVATEIKPVTTFTAAEDYHQGYHTKNPVSYKFYKWNCGRAQRLAEIWGKSPS